MTFCRRLVQKKGVLLLKKRTILTSAVAVALVMTSSFAAPAAPTFAFGTAASLPASDAPPVVSGWVQVSTAAQLEYIDQNQSQYLASNIELMNDIDLSGFPWVRFAGMSASFSGTFNGNGHVISNVQISDTTHVYVGFIGVLNGVVEAVGVSGTVNAASDSQASAVGGLVGDLYGGNITDSYAAASVTGGTTSYDGGLAGFSGASVTDTYATGSVTGGGYSDNGGLVGGQNGGSITDSYATGSVLGTGGLYNGGLLGDQVGGSNTGNSGGITGSFFDSQTTGQTSGVGSSSATGVTGETTAAMKTESTFTNAGWDFQSTWGMSASVNGGYPYLQAPVSQPASTAPSISSVSPTSGAPGTSVTIAGANFGSSQGSSTVDFGTTAAAVTSWSDTSITVTIPNVAAGTANVTVTVGGTASNSESFTALAPAPSISSVSPTSGAPGTSVTIAGANFGSSQGTSTVDFGTTAAAVTSWSDTSITVTVPNVAAGAADVTVTVGGTASNSESFTVTAPSISSVSPTSGAPGTSVTIAGSNFGSSQGTSTVDFGTTAAAVTSWSDTSITATVPNVAAGAANVTVTVGGTASNSESFTALAPPNAPPVVSGWVQVSTAAQLEYIDQNRSQYLGSNIELMNDIDLSGFPWVRFGGNSASNPFAGTFNGNGHVISNVQIDDTTHINVGFFGVTTGTVEAVGVSVTVDASSDPMVGSVGGLVGWEKSGSITDSYATASVTGGSSTSSDGGLVGTQNGSITSSHSAGSVSGGMSSLNGGLVGEQIGSITGSHASDTVTGGDGANDGGLVGIENANITDSYATGAVAGGRTSANGGLVGDQNSGTGSVTNTYATGSVTGGTSSENGGLVGQLSLNVVDSYASGAVTGGSNAYDGGLVGNNYGGSMSDSFFDTQTTGLTNGVGSGSATGTTGEATSAMQTESTFTNAGWDFTNTWGMSASVNSGYPYLQASTNQPASTAPSISSVSPTSGAPGTSVTIAGANFGGSQSGSTVDFGTTAAAVTSWSDTSITATVPNVAAGAANVTVTVGGTASNAESFTVTAPSNAPPVVSGWVQVSTAAQLEYIDQNQSQYLSSNIELMNDIALPNPTLASGNWVRIGGYSTPFSGTFNGNGYAISNIQINDTTHENVGLIGVLTGTVEAVGVNATVNTTNAQFSVGVGALVGREKSGSISDSYATGKVSGTANGNGGLVGLQNGGSISDSYAAASVSGENYSGNGGLVGQQGAGGTTITDSYATGAVSGGNSSYNGGLVGLQNGGSISDSYAAGLVTGETGSVNNGGLVGAWFSQSAITDSFFDSQTTGQTQGVGSSSATGATGEATSAMKTESTFTNAGWDFTNTWGMQSGVNSGYPYLQAFDVSSAVLPTVTGATYFGPGSGFYVGDFVILSGYNFPNGLTTVSQDVYLSSSSTQYVPLNPSSSGLVTGAVYAGVYSAGGFSNFVPISLGTISLVLPSSSLAAGGSSTFSATATSANAATLSGVPVDFTVNSAVFGPFPTNQNGVATYTFSPPGVGTYSVTASVYGQTTSPQTLQVSSTSPAPSIANLSTTSGTPGTSVTISGSNFGSSQGSSTVDFGATAAAVTSWSDTSITATVPNVAAGAANVTVTVGGTASNAESFTVTEPSNTGNGNNGGNGNNTAPVLPTVLAQQIVDAAGGTTTQIFGNTTVTVDVTPGAFTSNEQMTITTEDSSALSSQLSQGSNPAQNGNLPGVPDGAVAVVLGVNFSGAAPTKPITVTIQNPSIPANALFYKLGPNGQLIPVQATVTAGQAVVSFTSDPDFVGLSLQPNQRVLTMAGQTQVLPSFVQKDPISHVMTTYMPIWYLMQALKANGISSTWNGASWNLTTPGSTAVDLSNVKLGQGSMSISINGTVVEHVPGTVAKDPLHGNVTTYMPIWYVFQVLKRLGLTSEWNGHTWTLTAATATT